ncbi:MAG TPA: glycoside hydrolase family 97 N-terminal domain-containing protein [Terracidiphilus sp.]|nr:glycoside hydrolase family 97 N-terminal domain-containing protein [Terracidiphilus sp.]
MRISVLPSPALGSGGSGQLVYSVSFRGKPIIDNSALGLELSDDTPLGANVTIIAARPGSGVDDYVLTNAKSATFMMRTTASR